MSDSHLTIHLPNILSNWRALDGLSSPSVETGAVIKADGYGLGACQIGRHLAKAGVSSFFVATAQEGAALRKAVGQKPDIYLFIGHMPDSTALIAEFSLIPLINSPAQFKRHSALLQASPFGVQLDTGMSRLGFAPYEWADMKNQIISAKPCLIISHLACATTADHPLNKQQLNAFIAATEGLQIRRSLAATGGILLGSAYHFDLTRPGIGLHGCHPFAAGKPSLSLSLRVIQTRNVPKGAAVGYDAIWKAEKPTTIATVAAGYADGLMRVAGGNSEQIEIAAARAISNEPLSNAPTVFYVGAARALNHTPPSSGLNLWYKDTPCPIIGRISMDLITADISALKHTPEMLDIIGPHQSADTIAKIAQTIGYEILTSIGSRYKYHYTGI